jgi:hypothetical protein
MLTMMQILGYFELIVYIYIVCNRVFIELHNRNAHKASLFAMHFFAMHLLSPTAWEARKPTISRYARSLATFSNHSSLNALKRSTAEPNVLAH